MILFILGFASPFALFALFVFVEMILGEREYIPDGNPKFSQKARVELAEGRSITSP